jgi:hypothetical protein
MLEQLTRGQIEEMQKIGAAFPMNRWGNDYMVYYGEKDIKRYILIDKAFQPSQYQV